MSKKIGRITWPELVTGLALLLIASLLLLNQPPVFAGNQPCQSYDLTIGQKPMPQVDLNLDTLQDFQRPYSEVIPTRSLGISWYSPLGHVWDWRWQAYGRITENGKELAEGVYVVKGARL